MEQRLYRVPSVIGSVLSNAGGLLFFVLVGALFGPIGAIVGFAIGAALAANNLTGLRRRREDIRRINYMIEQSNEIYRGML
jgi:uncharacterized membrane protein YdjX (TVP38/TMEM64 family)